MTTTTYKPRLKTVYKKEILPALKKQFNYKSIMQVPKLTKISINQGIGSIMADKKLVERAVEEMTLLAGQKAVTTKSKVDISNFKLRANTPVGIRVTLRGNVMYEFLERFVCVALPRVRDFRGINEKGFDKKGNYTLGIKEQIIFPEIDIDKISKISGMDITFVTTAKTDKEALALLSALGLPFKNQN